MTTVSQPFPLVAHTLADADQVQADLAQIIATINGNLEADVNVIAGPSSAIDGDSSSPGGSNAVARSDHTHTVRGFEVLAADPIGKLGRHYFNSVTKAVRLCILTSPDTWITVGNLTAADLPLHSARHASGSSDPLPANAVDETMFKARTIFTGVPAADVSPSANAWTDVVTGLTPTITNSQVAWLVINAGVSNTSGSNSPKYAFRVIDGGGTCLYMSNNRQMSTAGANNDASPFSAVFPVLLAASPTLKLQVNTDLSGPRVLKSQTINAQVFAVTQLQVVVG